MGQYVIDVELYTIYNSQNIEKILRNGIDVGLEYYRYEVDELVPTTPLPVTEAVDQIIISNQDQMHCINVKIKDTFATLFFGDDLGGIGILMSNFTYPWLKKFNSEEEIDIIRYAKVLLELLTDEEIKEIRIHKD